MVKSNKNQKELTFRNSLKFKFFLLLGVFVVAIAAINLIHIGTSQKVADELVKVEVNNLPLYSTTFNLMGAFEGMSRSFEDAVTTGEEVLLDRAEEEYSKFKSYLTQLQSVEFYPFRSELQMIEVNSQFYFERSRALADTMLILDPAGLSSLGDRNIQNLSLEINQLREMIQRQLSQLFQQSSNQVFNTLSEARWAVKKQTKYSTAVGLFAFFVLFGFLLFISRRIIVPIRSLSSMISQVAKGNFQDVSTVLIKNKDEVGELGRSFKLMSKNLSESTVSRAYVDNIIRSMVDSLIVLDKAFVIQRVNRAACKLLGYSENDLVGKSMDILFREGFKIWCLKENLYTEKEVQKSEHHLISAAGASVPVFFSCSLLLGKNSELEGFVCLAQDITNLKRAEKELELRASELMRSNKELEQFAYVASHDLQEPLRMVTSYLQLLERRYREKLGEDALEYIDFAVDGATRMKSLINDLLTYSRVGRNQEELKIVSSQEVYLSTLKLLGPLIEEHQVEIKSDPLPEVLSDSTQLGQLFQNLLSNAIKYRGERTPKINISVKQKEEQWQFSIRDNGIGMDNKYLERIFVLFQRLHTKENYPGTGIGLALCKKIVERHKGSIWVSSILGKGSTFYFTLPKVQSELVGEKSV